MEEKSKEKEISIKSTEDGGLDEDLPTGKDTGNQNHLDSSNSGETPDIADQLPPHLEVISLVGKGGMGSVYKIRDKNQNQVFALKLMREDFAYDQTKNKRFRKEAESISKLSHPEIVSTFASDQTPTGIQYMIMEFVDGPNLQKYIKDNGPLAKEQAVDLFIKLTDAMIYAHQEKVIHRDLKPGNVLVINKDNELHPKIVDFGIAKILGTADGTTETLTGTGEIFGSPSYMSPEQCVGKDLDERSDIYSMGCLMYHCLTGKPPYESDTPLQTAFLHLKAEMPSLSESIDSNLKTIITGTLAKDPKDRYPSMESLRKDLERVAAKEKPLFKPTSPKQKSTLYPILITTSLCLVACLISAWYLNSSKIRPETPVVKKLIKPEEVKLPPADKLHTVDTTTLLSVVSLVGENSGWDLEERTRTNHTPSAFSGLAKVSDITKALIQKGSSNIQELTDGLYSKSGLVRKVCCDALKTIGISATPSLVDKIGKEGKTNKYVVELLQEFADESTPLLINKALETKEKEQYFLVRLIANIVATTNSDVSNIKNLEQLALNAESEESRSLATLMLVRQKSPDKTTIDTLAKLLSSDKSATVREAAASSLGAILQERQFEAQIIAALSRALNEDPVTRVRFSAAVNLGANCKIVDTKTLTPKANESDPFINQALLTALAVKDGPNTQSSESKVKALLEKNNPELTKADLQALYSFFHENTKQRGHAFNLLESAYGEKHAGFTLSYLMSYIAKDGLAKVPRTKYITEDIGRALFNMKKSNYPALTWLLNYKGENQKQFRNYFKQLNHLDLLEK